VDDALARQAGGYHELVLRGRGPQVAQAAPLQPTFVTLWIGNNDVLGAVVRNRAVDGVTTPVNVPHRVSAGGVVAQGRRATVMAANLPDVPPFPAPPSLPSWPIPLPAHVPLGPTGPLPTGSLVTLAASSFLAQGIGIPPRSARRVCPLPDEAVLDPAGERHP
jgi:hypothetical protein